MATVRAIAKVFIANAIREEGDVFEYDGPPNKYVEVVSGSVFAAPVAEAPTSEEAAPAAEKKWRPKAARASADKGSV